MINIRVNLYLRPIRFSFLVRPNDIKNILEIFRINTCLWGGKFNPIIPYFKRLPAWWERERYRFENAKQIINGYFDFFEPDFLVEAEKGLADDYGFDPKRVIQLNDILQHDEERAQDGYGLSVLDLYRDLYRKKFQFQRFHKYNIIHVKAKEKEFENFVACNFGSFPNQKNLKYFERNYRDIFDPAIIELDANALSKLYKSDYPSALSVGHEEIEIYYHQNYDPTLFIMNAHEPIDLIDFWNLRAVYRNIVAIPIQWIQELSPFCKNFILDNHRSFPGDLMFTESIFSRSIPEKDIEEICKNYLRVEKEGASFLTTRTCYPPIWRKRSEMSDRILRPTLKAASKCLDIPIISEKPEIHFEPLFPKFANEYGNRFRWANVVRLQEQNWSYKGQIATVFPCDYKNPSFPKFSSGDHLLPTAEGLIIFSQYRDISERWELVDGTTAINTWFNSNKIKAVLSDAGRSTQQIIQTLGGFRGVRSLAHKGIVELLNSISRKPGAKSIKFKDFNDEINKIIQRKNKILEKLVERKVVELGLKLKCSKCSSWSWYALRQLDYSLTCELCLRQFDFPITKPGDGTYSNWAYRVIGPFALPDYARGGYAASLAIRFFADVIRRGIPEVTWSSGQELILASGKTLEADFILWNQRKQMFDTVYPTEIVFGEAKSFAKNAFKQEDVNNMKLLAESFPGSILVFATMKEAEELSQKEVSHIRKLAEWGREYDRARKQSRAPVIMLTGTELFTQPHLIHTWLEKGGKYKELLEPDWFHIRLDNLRILADQTQQLYLGMPSYKEWLEAKWKKKSRRTE